MAKEISQINIGSTSAISHSLTVTDTLSPIDDTYDYNVSFRAPPSSVILSNDQYNVAHNGDTYTKQNDIIVNGLVIRSLNHFGIIAKVVPTVSVVDLGQKKIYVPPRKVDDVYVEQDPVSQITFTNTQTVIQPYFDGVAYGQWNKSRHDPYSVYTISEVGIHIRPYRTNQLSFYTADTLKYKAQWTYSDTPVYAAALNNMIYGALAIAPDSLFSANHYTGSGYNIRYSSRNTKNCFSDYEYKENGMWLIPFASEDEFNAAYAAMYTWDDSDIELINEFG